MKSRLAEMELRHRHIADSCPSLAELERVDHDRVAVFVHGTASCGIAGLRELFSQGVDYWPVPGHVYRFEHDTFVPIIENSKQLASLIQKSLTCRQLLFVAHSRGGLVAVEAARCLADANYAGKIEVQTFGTPFRGTPLVAIGQKVVNLFMKLGEEIATAVPVPVLSALAKGFFYLVEAPKLPAGIAAMHTQAPDMPYREQLIDKGALKAWGSDFDIESGSPGFGATVEGILLGALGKERHDLVVPMASAMAFSPCQPVLQCSHVHYFRQPAVRQAINTFLVNALAAEPSSVVPAAPVQTDQAAVEAAIKRKSKELHDRLRKG